VVLLHGLTDGPYSARHFAERYRDLGFVAVVIRLPGHGTVPGGLAHVDWEDWVAATHLAVREARRRVGPTKPLHLLGYSNGGALAMKYALEALEDNTLRLPDRIVLISPMIGITAFARFARCSAGPDRSLRLRGVARHHAGIQWFSTTRSPSTPRAVVAGRASTETDSAEYGAGQLARLPPILTFQSIVDFTVSTRDRRCAVFQLPTNGSELVLFDLNRFAIYGPLLRATARRCSNGSCLAPAQLCDFDHYQCDLSEPRGRRRRVDAGATIERVRPLGLAYPPDVFSLSHIALPCPIEDGLYGLKPNPHDDFGVNLGALATRGERGTLVVSIDVLNRISSNPFFPYVLQRLDESIATSLAQKH
jgi:alpha-beta hydrolase superfamily lysophospholipase